MDSNNNQTGVTSQFGYLVSKIVIHRHWTIARTKRFLRRLRRSQDYQQHSDPIELELEPTNYLKETQFIPPKQLNVKPIELFAATVIAENEEIQKLVMKNYWKEKIIKRTRRRYLQDIEVPLPDGMRLAFLRIFGELPNHFSSNIDAIISDLQYTPNFKAFLPPYAQSFQRNSIVLPFSTIKRSPYLFRVMTTTRYRPYPEISYIQDDDQGKRVKTSQ